MLYHLGFREQCDEKSHILIVVGGFAQVSETCLYEISDPRYQTLATISRCMNINRNSKLSSSSSTNHNV
jgi:hypothetical protein